MYGAARGWPSFPDIPGKTLMKSSLRLKLDQLSTRLVELNGLLGAEDVTRDLDRYRALTKEHSDLTPVVAKFREYQDAEADLAAAVDMASDPAMRST